MEKLIYLDNAATTKTAPEVVEAMLPYFSEQFFNPSAAYLPALMVRAAYLTAKDRIGRVIGAKGDDLVMTSGATEANALARAVVSPDGEALILATEHASLRNANTNASSKNSDTDNNANSMNPDVINTNTDTSNKNTSPSNINTDSGNTTSASSSTREIHVDHTGLIDLEDLKAKLSPRTELVSVSLANNELGTIQPLAKIAEIVAAERMRRLQAGEKRPIYLHSDASQALSLLSVNVARLGVDLLTLNAAKVYGPKGVGALYHGHQVRLRPLVPGGGQENGLRGGTENVPGVIGFAMALREASDHLTSHRQTMLALREQLRQKLNTAVVPPLFLGNPKHQLANFLPVSFPGLDAERLIFLLEEQGVLTATGAACAASKGQKSHVLAAIGLSDAEINGSLRLSLGRLNDEANIARAGELICAAVQAEAERIGLTAEDVATDPTKATTGAAEDTEPTVADKSKVSGDLDA